LRILFKGVESAWLIGDLGPGGLDIWDPLLKGIVMKWGTAIRIPNHQFTFESMYINSSWWQLKYFTVCIFTPKLWGNDPVLDERIFQMG